MLGRTPPRPPTHVSAFAALRNEESQIWLMLVHGAAYRKAVISCEPCSELPCRAASMLNSPVAEWRGLIVNRPATAAGKRPMSEAQKEAREQARKQQRLNGLEALERKVRPAVS